MNIYLADLFYMNSRVYDQPLPLNLGFIASYALAQMPDLQIKLFKHPDELIDAVAENPPDLLALSHYMWNANLNLQVIRKCKQYKQNLLVIMGGPNFTNDDPEWISWFFRNRPMVDLYISGEGEGSFFSLLQLLEEKGKAWEKVDPEQWPSSFFGYDHEKNLVINSLSNPVEQLDLSTMLSPYLSGLLDRFLEQENLSPIIETNRGCPYSCTFCVWGQATGSKLRQFNLDTVNQELNYIAERSANPTRLLYIADANFGVLKRDKEIAETIMKCRASHDFPQRIAASTAKNPTPHLMDMAEILSPIATMSLSLQSVDERVLKFVGRNNIRTDKYDSIRREAEARGIQTFCELIYGLPGESYESFLKGLIHITRSGQFVQMYEHYLLWGAEGSSRAQREQHGIVTAFRVQPDGLGEYGDLHSMEYDEVVVGTNDMTFEDFLRIRSLHALVATLSVRLFTEFRHALKYCDLDIATLSGMILEDEENWPEHLASLITRFKQSCCDELIMSDSDNIKTEFTKKDIREIEQSEIKQVPSFICRLFAKRENILEIHSYLVGALRRFFGDKVSTENLDDVQVALEISMDRAVCYDDLHKSKAIDCVYDLELWLSSEPVRPLRDFKLDSPITLHMDMREGIWEAFERAKKAATSHENAVYLLKDKFFPKSHDKIFYYIRRNQPSLAVVTPDRHPVAEV
jgi:radical SAM superfamily enzyme YgiQ (UPF0313 family)